MGFLGESAWVDTIVLVASGASIGSLIGEVRKIVRLKREVREYEDQLEADIAKWEAEMAEEMRVNWTDADLDALINDASNHKG